MNFSIFEKKKIDYAIKKKYGVINYYIKLLKFIY